MILKLEAFLRAYEYDKPRTAVQVNFLPLVTIAVRVGANLLSTLLLVTSMFAGHMLLSRLCPQTE